MTRKRALPAPSGKKPGDGWHVKCSYCDLEWGDRDTIKLDAVALHFDVTEGHPDQIAFELVWRGDGPEPPPPVQNRAARRRAAKKRNR